MQSVYGSNKEILYKKGLSFANLQSFGKWDSLMNKLLICVMGGANNLTSETSFKNLSDTFSFPTALLMSYVFKRFEMEFARIFDISQTKTKSIARFD